MSGFEQCPACGGAVHRIASRCKHCKADLLQHKQAAAKQQPTHKGLRQTFRGAAPAADSRPGRPATGDPTTAPPRLGSQHGPEVVYAEPSAWARRWPIAVSALAVVAIVASLVILLASKDEDDRGRLPSRTGNSPHTVPDNMQTPGPPQGSITPRPAPSDPFAPANPSSPKPKAWTTAPDPGMFAVALTESVCAKFEDCGVQSGFSQDVCRELAKGLSSPDVDAKVQSGQCSYDRSAASACLRAVDRLSCKLGLGSSSGGASGALADLMGQAAGLLDCSTALVCR